MTKSGSATTSARRRSSSSRKSTTGLRRVSVDPNSRTQSMKSDVSVGDSSVFALRPLPPLLKSNHDNKKSTEDTSSYLQQLVASKPILPPIKRTHQTHSGGKPDNKRRDLHHERVTSQNRQMYKTIPFDEGVDDLLQGEQFHPLRVSTPKNSTTMLRSSNSRTLPKPNYVTFRESSDTDQQEDILSSWYRKSSSRSRSRYDTLSDTYHGSDNDKEERRILSHTKTRQWVRSSDFTIKTSDKVLSSSETDNFPTVSSIPFDAGRSPENRKKPTSREQLRRIMSNLQPPSLPFKIIVHERVPKFNVDLQLRVQLIKDWWSALRFPRLPPITIDIDFARSREAVRRLCTRLRNSLRFRPPLILDPPPRFIIIPPSEWNLHHASMATHRERNRHKVKSGKQYPEGDDALVAGEDQVNLRSYDVVASVSRRSNIDSGLHVTFLDEKEDGAQNDFRVRRYSSSSRPPTKSYRGPLPKLTKNAGVSEVKFNSARERLASVLKKLDDPSWFGAWIAKHDEMERDLKSLSQKRLDLIRALTFTVDNEPCQKSVILGRVRDDDDRMETRRRMRVHHQYAHHRFGMSQRQPRSTPQPVVDADATALESEATVYYSKRAQPVYTDERPGCIACRVMEAARRYGCEDRLLQLSAKPTTENYYPTTVGDARPN